MLATGGSASSAITFIKRRGAESIAYVSDCSSEVREGSTDHPDVDIYCAAIDEKLMNMHILCQVLGMLETDCLVRNKI